MNNLIKKYKPSVKEYTLLFFIFIIAIIGGFFYKLNEIEPFNNLKTYKQNINYNNHKCHSNKLEDDVLLSDTYEINEPRPQFSNLNEQYQFKYADINESNSLESNNKRYRSLPTNGLCNPPGICGNFYKEKQVKKDEPVKPPPMYDEENPRVNFFLSKPF